MLATAGDTHLGGEDLDNRLIKHLLALIAKRHKVARAPTLTLTLSLSLSLSRSLSLTRSSSAGTAW